VTGRHREEVQSRLARLRVVQRLSKMFSHFFDQSSSLCVDAQPEIAVKIQILRFIQNYCVNNAQLHHFLTLAEYRHLGESSVPQDSDLMCQGPDGLMVQIVDALIRESPASSFK
jgi:hypothetical protein